MASSLSAVPAEKRRLLAGTLGLFAALFVAVGAVGATGADSGALTAFVVVALAVGIVAALLAWGVAHSITLDRRRAGDATADARLDAAIEAAVRAHGGQLCDCEHPHDPDELHITDACEHDGSAEQCSHDCSTCALAAMRPSPSAARAERLSH